MPAIPTSDWSVVRIYLREHHLPVAEVFTGHQRQHIALVGAFRQVRIAVQLHRTADQSNAGSAGIFSRRTNQMQEAQ
eukprot:9256829-Pyramimonas_sp.AAC.1